MILQNSFSRTTFSEIKNEFGKEEDRKKNTNSQNSNLLLLYVSQKFSLSKAITTTAETFVVSFLNYEQNRC